MFTDRIPQTDTEAPHFQPGIVVEGLRQASPSNLCQRCKDPLDSTEYPPLCCACYHETVS